MSQYVEENDFDKNLRLGDIIGGFSHIVPTFDDFFANGNEFTLEIKSQKYFSILTPCCSIEEQLITLAPLKQREEELRSRMGWVKLWKWLMGNGRNGT